MSARASRLLHPPRCPTPPIRENIGVGKALDDDVGVGKNLSECLGQSSQGVDKVTHQIMFTMILLKVLTIDLKKKNP